MKDHTYTLRTTAKEAQLKYYTASDTKYPIALLVDYIDIEPERSHGTDIL